MPQHLLIFGEGYTGARLRRRLEADGWRVTGTSRNGGAGTAASRFRPRRSRASPTSSAPSHPTRMATLPCGCMPTLWQL